MANVANLLQNANTIIGAFSTSKEFQDLLRNMSEATSKQVPTVALLQHAI